MEFKVVNYNQYKNNTNSIWAGAGNKLVYGVHPCTKDTLLSNVKYALEIGYDEVCMGHYLDMDDIDILKKLKELGITFNKIYISNISTNINLDVFRLNLLYDDGFRYVSYANCLGRYIDEIEEIRKSKGYLDYLISFTIQYINNADYYLTYRGRELYIWGLNSFREEEKKSKKEAKESIISSLKSLKEKNKDSDTHINIIIGSNNSNRIKENLELFNKYFKK